MLARKKILEYFDADTVKDTIHIVGCGAIGSHVAEQLVRIGCTNIHLYDFDTVEAHNITNQMFVQEDIGELKVNAVARLMQAINPDCTITVHPEGLQPPYNLYGHVFLCVDNIDLRREICEANKFNRAVITMSDFRMRLTDAQFYFADWHNRTDVKNFIASMQFSHEEATESTPTSACGTELSVIYTIKTIVSCGIHNFISYIQELETHPVILIDMKKLEILAM